MSKLPIENKEIQHTWRNHRVTIYSGLAIASLLILAGAIRFYKLSDLGYGNHYYAAAVTSMMQSWHNFFFAAAEPGGAVSVDKPPVGLWLQTISALIFGINSFGLLLPQILAGMGSVLLVYFLVKRYFGQIAGWVAGVTLAVTPVAVAVDRNNTIDSILVFFVLLATWMYIKATETGRLRYLLLGGALVGIAFNTKMMEAFLPVPAFFALYFLGIHEKIWIKMGKLVLSGILLAVVSLSWAVAVDLTPAESRPYVGSSGENSELSLIIGYNGINRLVGMSRGGRNTLGQISDNPSRNDQDTTNLPSIKPGTGELNGQQTGNHSQRPAGNAKPGSRNRQDTSSIVIGTTSSTAGNQARQTSRTPSDIGQAGVMRLFEYPLYKEMSWMLPFGLIGLTLLLAGSRLSWPLDRNHQAAILWGGWLLTGGIFFCVASYFHEYYLVTLAPPVAALVGIGSAKFWQLQERKPWVGAILFVLTAAATLIFQIDIASKFITQVSWQPYLWLVLILGMIFILLQTILLTQIALLKIGYGIVMTALFITPTVWSVYTALYPNNNASLPAAYTGNSSRSTRGSDRSGLSITQDLLSFLESNTQTNNYLMAVPSSMQGADYVLATGRPVLYLGGFKGSDQVVTEEELSEMVSSGALRYVFTGSKGSHGLKSDVSAWVETNCAQVSGFTTATQNQGNPDGTDSGTPVSGNQTISLYDCNP